MPGFVRLAALLWLVCAQSALAQASLQPQGWKADLALPGVEDVNDDPRILEVNLRAAITRIDVGEGRVVEAWTYNGGLPGPLIRVRVGDRLVVHFKNELPQPTTVHWHGLRIPIQSDGVPDHSQPPVLPGGTFTYDFVVPDAGLFWYHPHVMSAAQVGFGLYGPLLVEDPKEDAAIGVADELILVLSDMGVQDDGQLESPESGGPAGMVFGREGNRLLVNGRQGSTLVMRSGAPQRWRIVNAAKSRYFRLLLGEETFTVIGGDGGLNEYAVERDELVLAPGERADAVVAPKAEPGGELTLMTVPFNRGYGSVEYRAPELLLTVKVADQPRHAGFRLAPVGKSIAALNQAGATELDVAFTLDSTLTYGINGKAFAGHQALRASVGETQIWSVTNKTRWSHPFHLHGFFFQVLDERGQPVRPMAWKDTVDIPFEKTVRFVVRFDDRPGRWMYHCHILDHADGGLMGLVDVGGTGGTHRHHETGPASE